MEDKKEDKVRVEKKFVKNIFFKGYSIIVPSKSELKLNQEGLNREDFAGRLQSRPYHYPYEPPHIHSFQGDVARQAHNEYCLQ